MRARPVIGGVFIKMLEDPATWKKWASRDQAKVGGWAPAPCPRASPRSCRPPSTNRPSGATRSRSRRAIGPVPVSTTASGSKARAASARAGTPGAVDRHDLGHARHLAPPRGDPPGGTDPSRIQLRVYHDEDVEVYVDGVLAARQSGYVTAYELIEIQPAASSLLKPGAKVVLAVHCHQTRGGQGVDVGLVDVVDVTPAD